MDPLSRKGKSFIITIACADSKGRGFFWRNLSPRDNSPSPSFSTKIPGHIGDPTPTLPPSAWSHTPWRAALSRRCEADARPRMKGCVFECVRMRTKAQRPETKSSWTLREKLGALLYRIPISTKFVLLALSHPLGLSRWSGSARPPPQLTLSEALRRLDLIFLHRREKT